MLDEKLLKVLILFNAEAESRSCNPMTALMNRNPFKKTNTWSNKKKTDIFLNCLSENELNDLVSVVTLGNYDTHRRNDEKWNKTPWVPVSLMPPGKNALPACLPPSRSS